MNTIEICDQGAVIPISSRNYSPNYFLNITGNQKTYQTNQKLVWRSNTSTYIFALSNPKESPQLH